MPGRAFGRIAAAAGLLSLAAMAEAAIAAEQACGAASRNESFVLSAPALERSKRILVHLPEGYDCTARRYPVFYFNDGHDLFAWYPNDAELDPQLAAEMQAREAWYGSWRLDIQLDDAVAGGRLEPTILVGIASDDGMRSRDLAPVPWRGSSDARGLAYGAFVAGRVTAEIDRRFRTVADRRCRGIGGASLGGISALQIGLAHPQIFAHVLAFSPVLGDPAIAGYLVAAWRRQASGALPATVLVDFDDDGIGAADRSWFEGLVRHAAVARRRVLVRQAADGRHHIASWAERVLADLDLLVSDGFSRCGAG